MLLCCGVGKDSDAGRDWGQEEKGMTEDEKAGWHHWMDVQVSCIAADSLPSEPPGKPHLCE